MSVEEMPPKDSATTHFYGLTPERVLESVERFGRRCTGRVLALNSMENRVYEVECEEDEEPREQGGDDNFPGEHRPFHGASISARSVVVKFYRPGRWSAEQIGEEHRFLHELTVEEIPVISPLATSDGSTLLCDDPTGLFFTVFPKVAGRAPEELTQEMRSWLGRVVARMHNVGARSTAPCRIALCPETYGAQNLLFLLSEGVMPPHMETRYGTVVGRILEVIRPLFDGVPSLRLHGDTHLGNILWGSRGPFFLDFDDMVMGPAIQDLWLLFAGRLTGEHGAECNDVLSGYQELRDLPLRSLRLVEPLRTLRYIHFAAWIARRRTDPAFKRAFPEWGTDAYWSLQLRDLDEQLSIIEQEATGEALYN